MDKQPRTNQNRFQESDGGPIRCSVSRQIERRSCPGCVYWSLIVSHSAIAVLLPTQASTPTMPSRKRATTATRVLACNFEAPANVRTAISEARAERIPIRECEETSAAKSTAAMKIQNRIKGNSALDKSFLVGSVSEGVFCRNVQMCCSAKTKASGRVISSNPAKWLRLM